MTARIKLLLSALVATLLLSSCGGFTVGLGYGLDPYGYGYHSPRSNLYGLPFGYRPYNGGWYDDYCYNDGLWYYHGIDTPYAWCWPDYAY